MGCYASTISVTKRFSFPADTERQTLRLPRSRYGWLDFVRIEQSLETIDGVIGVKSGDASFDVDFDANSDTMEPARLCGLEIDLYVTDIARLSRHVRDHAHSGPPAAFVYSHDAFVVIGAGTGYLVFADGVPRSVVSCPPLDRAIGAFAEGEPWRYPLRDLNGVSEALGFDREGVSQRYPTVDLGERQLPVSIAPGLRPIHSGLVDVLADGADDVLRLIVAGSAETVVEFAGREREHVLEMVHAAKKDGDFHSGERLSSFVLRSMNDARLRSAAWNGRAG
jgi:hypothetical protein